MILERETVRSSGLADPLNSLEGISQGDPGRNKENSSFIRKVEHLNVHHGTTISKWIFFFFFSLASGFSKY